MPCICNAVKANCPNCGAERLVTKNTKWGDKASVRCDKAREQFPEDQAKFCDHIKKSWIVLACEACPQNAFTKQAEKENARLRRELMGKEPMPEEKEEAASTA